MSASLEARFDEDTPSGRGVRISDIRPGQITAVPGCKDTNPKDAIGIRKAPMSAVPTQVLLELGVAMLEGAAKYGRHNYRFAGIRSSVYFDAVVRHLFAWWEGEDIDPDSGLSHITKAIATLVVLRDAQMQGKVVDDRPPSARDQLWLKHLNERAAAVLDKHADKSPRHYTISDTLDCRFEG